MDNFFDFDVTLRKLDIKIKKFEIDEFSEANLSGIRVPNLILQNFYFKKSLKNWKKLRTLLLGSWFNFGNRVRDRKVFETLSQDFLINFRFSRINKIPSLSGVTQQ